MCRLKEQRTERSDEEESSTVVNRKGVKRFDVTAGCKEAWKSWRGRSNTNSGGSDAVTSCCIFPVGEEEFLARPRSRANVKIRDKVEAVRESVWVDCCLLRE